MDERVSGGARALIVGRSADLVASIEAAVQAMGWLEPTAAGSLAEAFGLVRGLGFDVVIVDVSGNEIDAPDFVRSVRDERSDAGVVLVTPQSGHPGVQAAAQSHAVGVLPVEGAVSRDEAVACLEQVLGAARQLRRRDTLMRWLERESLTDELTGLYNMRAFHDRLSEVCTVSRAISDPVTLIMLEAHPALFPRQHESDFDADGAYGRVANTVRRCIRATDFAARIDDQTFAVILPHSALDTGRLVARRIAHEIDRMNQTGRDDQAVLLIFGVVSGRTVSADKLIAAAQEQVRARKAQRHWVARIA